MTLPPLASPAELTAFHARHKVALLARDPALAQRLGRLAAAARPATFARDLAAYAAAWAEALAKEPAPGGHANALLHLVGHVRDRAAARALAAEVEAYRQGRAGLAGVKAAVRRRLEEEGADWAAGQSYLREEP